MILPKSFEDLMNSLTILPGVGEKTAERFVYSIYNNDIQEIENLSEALINFKKNIRICEKCGCLSDDNICNICLNEKRDKTTLCIVEDSKSVFFIEKTGKYNGLYHVINGLISPIDGINPEGFNREIGKGGIPICGLAYLTNGQGAVLEANMPFENNENKIN